MSKRQQSYRRAGRSGAAILAICVWMVWAEGAAFAQTTDQRTGSVLVFSLYSSSSAMPNQQNTRFAITNTSQNSFTLIHLFFIDGGSGIVADRYICLAAKQTTTFLASEQDPGTTGYLIAVAADFTGCPVSHNFLTGSAMVKLSTGHQAALPAEAFKALYMGTLSGCDGNSVTATLSFDGVIYERISRTLAVDNIRSNADGNDTRIALARVGGSLNSFASSIGTFSGSIYDEDGDAVNFNSSAGSQMVRRLDNNFPLTTPLFETFIPAGTSGWMSINMPSSVAIVGAVLEFNPNTFTANAAFTGGHNLRKLELASSVTLTIPVRAPAC